MDKDEYFKIIEEECCYNINNFFLDMDWALQSSIAHNSKVEEYEKQKRIEQDYKNHEVNSFHFSKKANLHYNLIKPYESFLSETQFFQRYKKIDETKKQEKFHKKASDIILNDENFFEKRISYFNKLLNSHANFRYKNNKLSYQSNYLLEKYSILSEFSLDKLPGLKPKSSWPVNLNDLISHLFNIDTFQMFHQPFDLNEEFHKNAFEFIENYYLYYIESLIKLEDQNSNNKKLIECESILYEEYLIKAIATLLTIKLMQGNILKLNNYLKGLKLLFLKYEKHKTFLKLNLKKVNRNILIRSLNDKMDEKNKNFNLPKLYLKNLLEYVKDNKILPIMRNYSIYDISSLAKNILFTPIRHIFSNCSSITTDSSYLFIILSGVNGGMIKLGTGFNRTIKGKIYLYIKFSDVNLFDINNSNIEATSINKNNLSSTVSNPKLNEGAFPSANLSSGNMNNPNDSKISSNNCINNNQNSNMNSFLQNDDSSYQWVYVKGKLYLKQNINNYNLNNSTFTGFSNSNASLKELGNLIIINPETFKVEGRIKMIFPENTKHPAIKKKNDNYILLTDGENINVLLLDPVFKHKENIGKKSNDTVVNSDSDVNENFHSETVLKDQVINKKSKYASYTASAIGNNFREVMPNFKEDLFSYINLNLLTYRIDNVYELETKKDGDRKRKIEEILNVDKEQEYNDEINETQITLINEFYDCFSHIYTLEECRKALILNNWNAEKTAIFLTDNEKEIKQPLLVPEKSTILFQTKIESITTRNNRVEYKTIKNPIFDTTQYDLLKWAITNKYVLGYKIKEGACIIFESNPGSQKNFPYTYLEKTKIYNPNSTGINPRNSLITKNNKAKFNVNWKEAYSVVGNNNADNQNISSSNKFSLKEEISIEKKILETIKFESFMESKILSNIGEQNIINSNNNFIFNNSNNNNSNSNIASPNMKERGNLIQDYLNEALSMEEIANLSNLGIEKSPSKFINAYLAKNEIKKVIRPQFLKGTSVFNTGNKNSQLSINFDSSVSNNPLNRGSFQNSLTNNYENYNANLSNSVNIVNFNNNFDSNTTNNFQTSLNNSITFKDENLKLLQNDVNNDKKDLKRIKKFNESSNNNNELLGCKKKRGKKKLKENDDNHEEKIKNKVHEKIGVENELTNPEKIENFNICENLEEVILEDNIKGTFLKVIPSLQLSKLDTVFCFDHVHNIYYLIGNSSVSLNLLISNTFCCDNELMENYFKDFKKKKNSKNEDYKLLSQIEDFINEDNIIDIDENKDYFDDINEMIKKLILLLNNNKQEMPWKYSNWNYFYLNIYELMNLKSKEYGMYESYSNEYCYPLLPSIFQNLENQNLKSFIKKINYSREIIHQQILEKLNLDELEGDNINIFFKPDELRKYFYNPSMNTRYDMDCYSNWNNLSYILIESKKEIKKKNQTLYLENKKNFFLNLDSKIENLNYIMEELEKNYIDLKNKISEVDIIMIFNKLKINLCLAYYWSKNSVLVDNENYEIIETLDKFEKILLNLFKIINNLNFKDYNLFEKFKILNSIIKIIITGWMTFCFDLDSQIKWFYIILDYSNILEERFTLFPKYEIGIKINLELAITFFDKNLYENSSNVKANDVLISPFRIILSILAPENSNNLIFNFDRINLFKFYELIPIKNELIQEYKSKIFNEKKFRNEETFKYISRPYFISVNSKLNSFPFYMLLFGKILNIDVKKESIVEDMIKEYIKNPLNDRINDFPDQNKKIHNLVSPVEIAKEFSSSKIVPYLDFESPFGNKPFIVNDFNTKILLGENNKNVFEHEGLLVKIILKIFKIKKNFTNFKLIKYSNNEEDNKLQFLDEENINFWKFLEKEIDKPNANMIIDFVSNALFCCVGEINEYISYLLSISSNNIKVKEQECHLLDKTKEYLLKNFKILKNFLTIKKSLQNLFITRGITDRTKYENNHLDIIDNFLNIPSFKLLSFYLYTMLSKFNLFLSNKLNEKTIESSINVFTEIIDEILKLDITTDKKAKEKLSQLRIHNLLEFISPSSHDGKNIQAEKYFEFLLGNEIIQINETIHIPENNLIAVEIDFNLVKEKPFNYDLVIISEDHSYNNMRLNTNNNFNNFGTCFTLKLNNTFSKTLFLIGKEIKIFSPIDVEFGKGGISNARNGYRVKNKTNISATPKSQKSILKIKCYPYKYSDFGLLKKNKIINILTKENEIISDAIREKEINLCTYKKLKYFLEEDELNQFIVFYILDFLKTINFASFKLIRNLIKSISNTENIEKYNHSQIFHINNITTSLINNSNFNLKKTLNQDVINENNRKVISEYILRSGLKIDVLNNLEEKDIEFNANEILCLENKLNYAQSGRKSLFNQNNAPENFDIQQLFPSFNLMKLNQLPNEFENKINIENNPAEVLDLLENKFNIFNLTLYYLDKNLHVKSNERINLSESKLKNKQKETIFYDYITMLNNEINVIQAEIIKIIRVINKISISKDIVFSKDLEDEIKETLKISKELKTNIRSLVPEPNNYRSIKLFPSFTKELKNIWNILEQLFIAILINYLGLEDEIFNQKVDNFTIDILHGIKKETYIFLGNKVNLILNWMSAKVQQKKDTFDSLKSYIEFLIELKIKDLNQRKNQIIEKIINYHQNELEKVEMSKIKEDSVQIQSKLKKTDKSTKKQKEIHEIKGIDQANLKGKPKNFKKKQNVKRLYQDIKSSTSKKTSSQKETYTPIENIENQKYPNENIISEDNPLKNNLFTIEHLKEMNINSLISQFSIKYPQAFIINAEEIQMIQEEINTKIESDIEEAYLGNPQKLKSIMEVNELIFDDNNLSESIQNYIKFIKKKITFYIDCANLNNINSLFKEINKFPMIEVLKYESPFYQMGFKILEKLLFIFELNSQNDLNFYNKKCDLKFKTNNSNNDFPRVFFMEEISDKNNDDNLDIKKINSIKSDSNKSLIDYQENLSSQGVYVKHQIFNLHLNTHQNKILDSIFNLIHSKFDINQIRNIMLNQNNRMYVRLLGLNSLNYILNSNFKLLIYSFKSLPGILSSSIKKKFEDEAETSLNLRQYKNYPLINLLIHFINLYNDSIEIIYSSEAKQFKISSFNFSYGINDLMQLDKFSKAKALKIKDKEIKDENKDLDLEKSNFVLESNLQSFSKIEISYHLEVLNLILSDLIIIFNHLNENSDFKYHKNLNLINNKESFESFISKSLMLVYNNHNLENLNSNKNTQIMNDFKANLMIVFSKLVSVKFQSENNFHIYLLREILLDNLFNRLEDLLNKNDLNNEIISILEILYNVSNYISLKSEKDISDSKSLIRGFEILFKIIIISDIHQIITLCCNIFKSLIKNFINDKINIFDSAIVNKSFLREIINKFYYAIFEKLGKILIFKNKIINLNNISNNISNWNSEKLEKERNEINKEDKSLNNNAYYLLIHMNSPEIDYQFLVNALFYWEEKYPTKLSLYKFKEEYLEFLNDKNKEKEILEKLGINRALINANINIGNSGQKTKMYNYFNPLKAKNCKISYLDKIIDERLANIKKAIEEGNKFFNSKKEKEESSLLNSQINSNSNILTSPSPLSSGLDSIKERINKLKIQEAYQYRIKAHIKLAEIIGETASIRGYVCLEPFLPKENAEELAEILQKAYNHLLPHFKANVEEKINLFPDELIYPKMPDKDLLLPGCTNILKETTISYMNVTLCKKEIYEKIENSQKGFFETIRNNASAKSDDKKIKAGLFSNNIFGLSNSFLNTINYNESKKYEPVINNECAFGSTISMIIQELVNLFYEINNNNLKYLNSESSIEKLHLHSIHNMSSNILEKENFTFEFINILTDNLKKLNLETWKNRIENNEKIKILGMLIICCDYYGIIRENTNAIFNNDEENECKILSGGHKSGKNKSYVLFTNEEKISIDKIELVNLKKKKSNLHLINRIPIFDLFESAIKAFEIYRDNKDNLVNKMLFQLILKLIQDVKIDNNHDLIFKIYIGDEKEENKRKLIKFIEILKSVSNETVWLEKEDQFWEREFIDSFERIYDRIDKNSELIFSPIFHFTGDNLSENPIEYKKINCNDLITKFNLPDSNYKKYLPKINDMSKFQTALKNIVNFDRYVVGEIFNYCKSQYRDDEYLNYLYQIRYHLSNGDIVSAKSDIHTIFDNNKMPQGLPLPRESYDNKEITKEDCFPGNYYLAKISNMLLKETKIKGLKVKGSIGITDVPVLLLLIDNSINQALVLYNDVQYSRATTFWINIDDLTFLDTQIKIPANSFKITELFKEFNYLEKRLRILFSKKILLKLMKIFAMEKKFNNFEETLLYLNLNDWNNFKLNPISGVFRKFKNYIRIKKKDNPNIKFQNSKSVLLAEIKTEEAVSKLTTPDFNINEIIYSCSDIVLHKNKFENSIMEGKKSTKGHNIENLLAELKINEKPVNELIIQWSMNNWNNLDDHFLKLKTDLFAEYNTRYDGKLRTKEMFHIGNFNRKMLALHELCRFDISNYAGIILSFEKEAILGPHAKISFYSDPYGENLVDEIESIKTTKSNLETVVFNCPKIWMHYTPGTRAFYIFEWYTLNRDSFLPCSIVFIPHVWTNIVSLTDYSTASLLSDLNVNMENLEILSKFIRKLLNHCTSMSLPAELQRRVFNITNRTILKASKYLFLLEQQKNINFKQFSVSKKFNILGIDEFALMKLIEIITNFDVDQKDKNFSSAYIVEGVEIILSILAVIKEPFNILDKYLRETFNYILPMRIEAIIKLGQFLNFFQGTASLEGILMKEIYDQLKIENQINNIIFIENINKVIPNDIILEHLRNLLSINKAKVVDFDNDIKIFENECYKYIFILIDGFIIENLTEKIEEIKEPEPEDEMWICFYCSMENDKDNTFCIFCDKNKKIKPKDKPPKKSNLIKTISFDFTLQDLMNSFIDQLRSLNTKLNERLEKIDLVDSSLINNSIGDINIIYSNSDLWKNTKYKMYLNEFFQARIISYAEDYDYITQKIRILNNIPTIKKALNSQINYLCELVENLKKLKSEKSEINSNKVIERESDTIRKEKYYDVIKDLNELEKKKLSIIKTMKNPSEDFILFFESLQNNGVDLWFENSILDSQSRNNVVEIKLLEKLREFIDIRICKEKGFSLNLQAVCLRFVPSHFNSINCYLAENLETYSKEFRNLNISHIRFYWTLIKYFNNCLCAALPIIKPPDTYLTENLLHNTDDEYLNLPFPKTMSAFLSSARGIAFSITKQNLIRDIIAYTEFSEEQVQIPTFKFERLNIENHLENNISNKKNENKFLRKSLQNFNLNINAFPAINGDIYSNQNAYLNILSNTKLSEISNNPISIEENIPKIIKQNIVEDLSSDESLFIQAFEQAKAIDPAFFRSKKMPGDPHIGFKVEFKGELVVGIGGPYRQFFSDISSELQNIDVKNKKLLKLLHPTSNNINGKGEFKDKFCICPSYNSNTALLYYEFLGLLMGICIRTGVHLTLDLCSLTWKKILSEILTIDDIIEFDEGLNETINFIINPSLKEEEFQSTVNLTYTIELTDGKIIELIPNGLKEKVEFTDRFKFLELSLKARLCEGDSQISMLKKGLCKIIPESLLKLLTYKELERLVCGVKTVDLELLKANTKLSSDLNQNSFKVNWLWEILNEISDEEKIKFVKFCWAQERLPSTHEEFQKLQVVFMIKSYLDKNKKDQFPKADTCFFSIELPEYSSKEIMKKKILQAINLDNVSINADKVTNENQILNSGSYNNNIMRYSEYDDDDDYIID